MKKIMEVAYRNHILIPAFNVPYLPMVQPICGILKRYQTFGLIEVARPDVEKFKAKSFSSAAEEFNKYADRNYCRLHQDHIPVIDEDGKRVDWRSLISEALNIGYDSVMIDGSRLSLLENIQVTREVVEMANKKGIPVEAELGAVMGHEEGPLPPYEEIFQSGKGFTDIEEAKRFVKETGVKWLSVAIGNIHGALSKAKRDEKKVEAKLNIEHLSRISEAVNIPLVLHGGSGVRLKYLLEAIQNGITKINIGTVLRQAYERNLGRGIEAAQEAVSEEIEKLIRNYHIEGSALKLISS